MRDLVIKEGEDFDVRKIEESKSRLELRPYVASVETGPLQMAADRGESHRAAHYAGSLRIPFLITDYIGFGADGAIAFQAGASGATDLTGIFNISLVNLFRRGEKELVT